MDLITDTKRRRALAAIAAATALAGTLGAAQAASAADVRIDGDTVVVEDAIGNVNHLTVERHGLGLRARVRVRDTATDPTAGPGCAVDTADRSLVVCQDRERVNVQAGGNEDVVAVDPALSGDVAGGSHDDLLMVGTGTWPDGMAARADELAALTRNTRTVRWAGPFTSDTPSSPDLVARAWGLAVDTAKDHPTAGAGASGPRSNGLRLDGGTNDDVVLGDAGNDTLSGGTGFNFVAGGAGNDELASADGAWDTFVPGDGADRLIGHSRSHTTADYHEVHATLKADLEATTVDDADGAPDIAANLRGFMGGHGRNLVTGSAFSELLYGSAENDELAGGGRNDLIVGGPVEEGPSIPRIGGDVLSGGTSADAIVSETSSDTIYGNTAASPLGAYDVVVYGGRTQPVTVDLATGHGGAAGEDDLLYGVSAAVGGSGNDVLRDSGQFGAYPDNLLDGAAGDDRIFAGNHAGDEVFGGDGEDAIDTRGTGQIAGASTVHCGNGADGVDGKAGDTIDADCERVDRR